MEKANRFTLFSILLIALLVIGLVLPCGTVMAQDDEVTLEEVVVTGSRIVRNSNDSPSPIVTVDEDLFDQSSTTAIETQLNKLPQFTPTIDLPTTGGDIQPTARNTPGEATVALRGLGANRSLVLINGRRGTPSNGMGVLDINTIPVAAIEYVEAISGGASSTYGADAMAGVINFIMKDEFVGFELDVQSGITQEHDNMEYQVSGVIGSDISEGRGNVMVAFSYNERNDALQADREWYTDLWKDPSVGATQFFPQDTGMVSDTSYGYGNAFDPEALLAAMPNSTWAAGNSTGGVTVFFTRDGQAYSGYGNGMAGVSEAEALGIVDGFGVKLLNSGYIGQNNITNYLILPMERYNTYSQGNFEINDWLGVFMQGYFSKVSTLTIQEPGPITSGWGVNIYPDYNRDAIPQEALDILDSRADPSAPFSIRAMLPRNRQTKTDTSTYNITLGLEGEIPGINWSWEFFHSHGEAETYAQSLGYWSLERARIVMGGVIGYNDDGTPRFYDGYQNFGEGMVIKGNSYPADGGFGAATATCTSGINPFDWSTMTEDCWRAVMADVKTHMLMKQDIWEVNTQGPIFDLPMGEVRGALGWSYRKNAFFFLSDNLNMEGTSFNDQILGLYPAADSQGQIQSREYYAELMIPILSDLPFIKSLTVELGMRTSDYDSTGRSDTYKALFDWRTNDWLRFRGGYNRAERAPNIAELFLQPEQTFGALSYGDVCSLRNAVAPTTANPEQNPSGWLNVLELCGQLMDRSAGNPVNDLDLEFFGADYHDIIAYAQANNITTQAGLYGPDADGDGIADNGAPIVDTEFNQMTAGGFGFLWPLNVGNPGLQPERADTVTLGIVVDSPFEDTPWLDSWRFSIDYYTIEIKDAIGSQSADTVMYQCVDPLFNPGYSVDSPYCAGFNRDVRFGSLGQIEKSYFNSGRFETSGIDFNINWSANVGPGRLNINTLINYLLDKSSAELPTDRLVDYTGTLGPTQNGLNGNSYEWRALTTVGYSYEDWRVSLRWSYRDSIEQASVATSGFSTSSGYPAYHLFDLLMNYNVNNNVSLRFGIENLFDKAPPVGGVTYAQYAADGMTGGSYSAGNYDTVGRRFYLGMRVYLD